MAKQREICVTLAVVACVTLIPAPVVFGAELLGRLVGGTPWDVWVEGDYAYLAAGVAVSVVDVSDPTNPTQVAFYVASGDAHGIAVSGGYAFIAGHKPGLTVMDVTSPGDPRQCGRLEMPGLARSIFLDGNRAFVTGSGGRLGIVGIENPCSPREIGSIRTNGLSRSACVSGKYVYVADARDGLRVIDIRGGPHPKQVGHYGRDITDVAISGDYGFLADGDLTVIDLSDPVRPSKVTEFDEYSCEGLFITDTHAYVVREGLGIIDISDPTSPWGCAWLRSPGQTRAVYVSGGYAYVVDNCQGLRVIDVSNPQVPEEVGLFNPPTYPWDIYVEGDYAYVADRYTGLRIIDVGDPSAPSEVGRYSPPKPPDKVTRNPKSDIVMSVRIPPPMDARAVHVCGCYAYLVGNLAVETEIEDIVSSGLKVIDICDPHNPQETGWVKAQFTGTDISVEDGYAYVAAAPGLRVIDIVDPYNPNEISSISLPGIATGICVSSGYAYVTCGGRPRSEKGRWAGLRVVDVTSPYSPKDVGALDISGLPEDVLIAGNLALVCTGRDIRIIDVTDPQNLREVGTIDAQGGARKVTVSGDYAYVAAPGTGLLVADISDPSAPQVVDEFSTPGMAGSVAVASNHVYLGDLGSGIWILEGFPAR